MSIQRTLFRTMQAMLTTSVPRRTAKSPRGSRPYRSPFLFEHLESRQLMAVTMDADGWTVVTPSGDSRVIYVSSSQGNDANDGLSESTPKATIQAGMGLMRAGYPDHLLLKRGDTWTTTSSMNSSIGRSLTEPHYIGAYGTGARPKISNVDSNVFRLVSRNYVFIMGIHFDGTTRTEEDTSGAAIALAGKGIGYHIEDCYMDSFKGGASLSGYLGVFEDVTIRRNLIVNSWSGTGHCQGMYIDTTHGLLVEENILDHNGWHETLGTGATVYNHNLYITHETRDVTIRNNIISRGASAGLKFQPNGGTHYVTDNLFVKNAIVGTVGGGQEDKVIPGQGAVIYWNNNVAVEPQDNGTGERGGLTSSNLEGGTFHDNILAHAPDVTIQAYWTAGWESQGVGVDNFSIQNNVFYDWRGGVGIRSFAEDLTFKNNILHEPSQPANRVVAEVATGATFAEISGNKYHSNAAAGTWFEIDDVDTDYAGWIAETGETGSSKSRLNFVDPTRSVTTYAASLGITTYDAFMNTVKLQSKSNWDPRLSAETINEYIRAGFQVDTVGVTPLPSPSAPTSSSFVPTPAFEVAGQFYVPQSPSTSEESLSDEPTSSANADETKSPQQLYWSEQLEESESEEFEADAADQGDSDTSELASSNDAADQAFEELESTFAASGW